MSHDEDTLEKIEEIFEVDAIAHPTEGNYTSGKTMREKMENIVVTSSVFLTALLLAGHILRRKSRWLRALHLPSAVVGGMVGWVVFALLDMCGAETISDEWFSIGWSVLPGFCTNLVFSCLFLGTPVPRPAVIVQSPRREHLIYGLFVVRSRPTHLHTRFSGLAMHSQNCPTAFSVIPCLGKSRRLDMLAMRSLLLRSSASTPSAPS